MKRSTARRWGLAGLLVAVTAAAPALAGPGKNYTASIDGTAAAGRTVTFKVTLAVPNSQQQQLGSAQLTLPAGYTVESASSPVGTVATTSGTALFEELEVQPGGSVTVSVIATIGCDTTASRWTVEAKQANDFNGTPGNALTTSSVLDTPVVGACTPCPDELSAADCSVTQAAGNHTFRVNGLPNAGNDAGVLSLAVNAGLSIDCAGYTETTSTTALFEFTGTRQKIATLIVPKRSLPRGGINALEICFGAPEPFTGSTPQGSFDWDYDGDLDPVHVGLLPDCDETVTVRCVTLRDRLADGAGIIQALLPEGDPAYRG